MNSTDPKTLSKETIMLPDGRYLIYYQFEDPEKTANQTKAACAKEKKHV